MMELRQSEVLFNEENHSYMLGDRRLLGITGLIHSILGLGVYPDANEHVKDFIIPRAGSRGTAVHHAIQTYDLMGIRQETQIVRTRYGCRERQNVTYKDEVWDVGSELDAYIRHLEGFTAIANEYTVDNGKYASQIDNVWLNNETQGIWLVDTKTNNISLYPLCGYFNPNYFSSGRDALMEYLSWQLSIYALLFERQNPGLKVEGLACNWLRADDDEFWVIERKPDELVEELLSSDYFFTDNGPVYFHPNLEVFGIGIELPAEQGQETLPVVPADVVDYFTELLRAYKDTETRLAEAKKALRAAMAEHNVRTCDFKTFSATIAADSETSSFDSVRFKKDHPELYAAYVTKKAKKGGFIIKLKDND